MNDELNKRLAELASKLNVSVEHLWGVLIRQAYIDGLSSLLTVLVCLVLGVFAVFWFVWLQRKYRNVSPDELRLSMWPPPEYARWLLFGCVLFMLLLVASNNFYWVLSDFFNPEWYAFRQLPFPK
jgi:hypothetical protein